MNLSEICKRLGYPKHTDKIYQSLLNSKEPLLVSDLAKVNKISRVVVYRSLKELAANNLVSIVRFGKRTFYQAESPHQLSECMRIVEQESHELAILMAKKREKDVPQYVRFLYGAEGIREAFSDVIAHTNKGDTFFRYTSERDLEKVNAYLARDYRIQRDKKKLERLVISNAVSGSQKRSRLERFVKCIPQDGDQFEQNVIQLIYGDRVSIIDLTKEEVTIIENKQLAEFQKVIFKLLYKRL